MSVAVCRSSAAAAFESILTLPAAFAAPPTTNSWLLSPNYANKHDQEAEKPPGESDIWSSIQAQKPKEQLEPYVHPLMRRSSSVLSQKSLEICTESLGSETGSDDFFTDFPSPKEEESEQTPEPEQEFEYVETARRKEAAAATVNYHCSVGRRASPPRSFPPPLPSISRRDGPCLQMRPHRRDGRLVVEAVPVPSQNYLHAERQGGRLLLSFINTAPSAVDNAIMEKNPVQTEEIEEEEIMEAEEYQEEEEEEEVEVVDRGTVVEVKVSMQPQQSGGGGGAATMKVHRSSIVINKFVSCMSISDNHAITAATEEETESPPHSPVRRLSTATTTTAAVAAVAASSLSATAAADGSHSSATDNKLLFTSRRRNREELLHDMRRCSQLRKPLFIWEPCCIATSS